MTAVGADMGFTYTTAAAFVMAKRAGDKKQMIISGLGVCFAVFFIGLLIFPFAPGFLSPQAWAFPLFVGNGGTFFAIKHKTYYASTALQDKVASVCAANVDDEDVQEAFDCDHPKNK